MYLHKTEEDNSWNKDNHEYRISIADNDHHLYENNQAEHQYTDR